MGSRDTAGKGPGLVLRAHDESGAVRLSEQRKHRKGVLQILEANGIHSQLELTPSELRVLAQALAKVAAALDAESMVEEITQ